MSIHPTSMIRGAATALALAATPALPTTAALADTREERLQRGEAVIRALNGGAPQPALEAMRRDFPFLAEATQAYALGDVWARPGLDTRTRQLAAVAAFASLGLPAFLKIHAGYALNAGVSEAELKEVVYLVTVTAGFPRAITAAQALSELFAERRAAAAPAQE
jgi:4-carboxymuconolactone decarboxylase